MTSDVEPENAETALRRPIKCCPECAQRYSSDSMFCPFDGSKLEEIIWVAPTDPSVDPLLGSIIDSRYRVARVLGEGGAGTVYEVIHQTLSRAFAMKVLRRDLATDEALAARFIQEVRATASLKHAHIVSITDFGHLPDKTPYFVMERLVGNTLAHVCKVGGQLPTARAVHIIMQVADALGAAHEAGIIHRDLKPENIFLVGPIDGGGKEGDDVRIVDFGAAKITGASRITKTGIVFGTPHYMAPEQASGQPIDHRADIYALGVIMYEILSGHLPFEADTLMGVLTKHMFVDPPRFAEDAANGEDGKLLGALEAVTLRAMAKKPEQRFQTMAALAAELERTVSFGDGGGVALSPGWTPSPMRGSHPPPRELSRMLEGPERSDAYTSGDLAVLPRTSWRGGALIGLGLLALVVIVGSLAFGRTVPPPKAVVLQPIPSVAPSLPVSPVPMLRFVHLTTTPSFAEVWQDGHRIGTAPMELPLDPNGAATQCTVRAPGYVELPLVVDTTATSPLVVTLTKLAPPPVAPLAAPKAHRAPASHHGSSDGELVDPFSR